MRETYILCACILHFLCVGHPFSILVLYLTFSVLWTHLLVFWYCGHVLDIFVLWTCAFIYIYLCYGHVFLYIL